MIPRDAKAPCCDNWLEATGNASYDAQIEQQGDGKWAVCGCCGGDCHVLTNIKFCPWCGSSVATNNDSGKKK